MDKKKTELIPSLIGLLGAIGGVLTVHHKVERGEWWDEKTRCHGKIGAGMIVSSLIGILGLGILEGSDR